MAPSLKVAEEGPGTNQQDNYQQYEEDGVGPHGGPDDGGHVLDYKHGHGSNQGSSKASHSSENDDYQQARDQVIGGCWIESRRGAESHSPRPPGRHADPHSGRRKPLPLRAAELSRPRI